MAKNAPNVKLSFVTGPSPLGMASSKNGSPADDTYSEHGSIGKFTDDHTQDVSVAETSCIDTHRTSGFTVAIKGNAHWHAFFAEAAILLIDEQVVADRVIGNNQIHPAVVIEIDDRDAQGFAFRNRGIRIVDVQPSSFGNVLESTISFVVVRLKTCR